MEENNEILRYAQELSREIRPRGSEPDEVTWDDGLPLDRVIVRYSEVKLPSGMKGRLTPEDWRPLIASSIIYNQSLYRAQRRGSIVRLVLPLGVGEVPLIFALLQIFHMRNEQANHRTHSRHCGLDPLRLFGTVAPPSLALEKPLLRGGQTRC